MCTKNGKESRLMILQTEVAYRHLRYKLCGKNSHYEEETLKGYIEAYINLSDAPILIEGKLLK